MRLRKRESVIATLQFKIPDEEQEFIHAHQGAALYSAMWDFAEFIRNMDKHCNLSDEKQQQLDFIRKEFFDCVNETQLQF